MVEIRKEMGVKSTSDTALRCTRCNKDMSKEKVLYTMPGGRLCGDCRKAATCECQELKLSDYQPPEYHYKCKVCGQVYASANYLGETLKREVATRSVEKGNQND